MFRTNCLWRQQEAKGYYGGEWQEAPIQPRRKD